MKRYKTPAGNEYSEEELRSKYGEQFDSLVADGTLQLVGEAVNSEKKNPIVTSLDGEEVLTESTTETEIQDGVSDSLEVNKVVDEGVINESELNFGDQTGPKSIDTEVSEVKEEDGFGEYIGKGLDVGASTVSKSIYDLPSLIYDAAATITNPIARALGIEEASSEKFAKTFNLRNIPSEIVGKRIAEKQKEIQEYNNANGGDPLTAFEDGNILGAAKMIAGTAAQSIPLMIPAFLSGGSSVGLGVVGASTASTKAATIKENNPDLDVSSRTINAVATGVLEATLGQLLTGASGNVTKKILSTEGSKKGAKIISDSFKEMLESSIEKSPILPLFGEILEESLVSVGEQLTDISTGIKTDFSMREVINSGISAIGIGGTNTVSVYAAKGYVSAKEYRELKQVNKKLSKLSDEVLNSNLSTNEKTLLNQSIDRLKSQGQKIVDDANSKVSLLPDDVKKELDNTLLNLDEISVAAFRINSNKDTPIEIKEVLLNELKSQAIELTDKKNKILSAEYILNQFEKLPDNEKASLKEQATEILLKEAQDSGQTEINITENQISDKANEIYNSKEKAPLNEQEVIRKKQLEDAISQPKNEEDTVTIDDSTIKRDEAVNELQKLNKTDRDAISEPITEEQVLPNEETSGVEGSNLEVGLQQVGEGNLEQLTTGKKDGTADTQPNQVSDTATETDTEQLADTTSDSDAMSVNKERVDSIVDGIVEKTKARNVGKDTDPKKILKNTLSYLQGSKLYQEATDIERENAVREINEKLGIKIKKPPTTAAAIKKAGKVLGLDIPTPVSKQKFTSTVGKEIKVFWNNWNKAFRESKYDQDTKRKDLNEIINSLEKSGNLSKAKSKSLRDKVAKVNLNNTKVVSDVIDYARKSMNDADYTNKLNKSKKLRSLIKKNAKTKEAGLSDSAKNFSEIDPSKVEDIDTYLEKSQEIKDGLIPTKEVKSGLKTSTPFDTKKTDEYTSKEKESQKEKAYELQKESFVDLTGLDPKDLTLEEMRDLLIALDGDTLTEQGKSEAAEKKRDVVEKALKQAISNAKINAKQVIADSDVEVSKQDKKLLSEFLKMDMNVLTTKQKMKALDAILIFETNQSTGGMESILKQAEGKKGMTSLLKQKIITSAKSWMVGRYWNKGISSLPIQFELMFGSPRKGAIAMKEIGVTDAINGAAKAEKKSEDIIKDYGNSFSKKKMKSGVYFNESNDIERGILGEVQRFTPGQEVKDFTDSKNLIEETYENLLKSTNKENIAKGEIIKEAYDRLVKDSNNISEVQSKADPANLEGVKYITDVWASNYESLAEVSLNVYNKNLGKDTNYIPRSIQNISVEKSPDRDITQPLFNPDGTSSVYSKKTGVLEEATKPGKFEDSNKILNLGFDSQNMANLKSALTDVNTAAAIQQIKGAIESDAFNQVFPNDQSRKIIKNSIIKYIDLKRAGERVNEDDKKVLKILNKGATFGVVKALGGLTQPLKQLVPIFSTAWNAGSINTAKASALIFNKDVQDAINNSGLGIANRGASSQGDISGIDSRIKQSAKTKQGKLVDVIDKLNKDIIDIFLVKTDVQTARASFVAYYLKAMDKKGVKSEDIDFTKPLDKESAQYAQQQVDRQQNTSDSDLQGDLFTGKGVAVQVFRKTLFPFANFLMNQTTRMYSDINTLTRKRSTSLPGDKTAAAKSLAGLATETVVFNAIGLLITQMLSNVARMYTGDEEDPNLTSFKNREENKKKKEKEFESRLAGRLGNVVADVIVPIPFFNDLVLSQANSLIGIIQEGNEDPFQFFAKTEKGLKDQLGVFGIGLKKSGILVDMIMTINSGEVTSEYFGKKSSKKLTPEAIEDLKGVAIAYALHLAGALPFSEVGYLSERAYKNISKMKVIDKKRNLEDEAYDLLEEEGEKAPNETQVKERVKRIRREEKSGSSANLLNTKSKLTGGLSTNLLKRKSLLD